MINEFNAIRANGAVITSAITETKEAAKKEILEKLSKPGRENILETWEKEGCLIASR